jgi:hypothetical protein
MNCEIDREFRERMIASMAKIESDVTHIKGKITDQF